MNVRRARRTASVIATALGAFTIGTHAQAYTGTPYLGSPAPVPGTIQAADFDNGGLGVAYYDSTPGNAGGQYRETDVDIAASVEGGYTIGWIAPGEWVNYTVNVASSGSYTAQIRVAAPSGGGALLIGFNQSPSSWTQVSIPPTGDWQTWVSISVPMTLTAGVQQMALGFESAGYNVSYVTLTAGASVTSTPASGILSPFLGSPALVPGTIQAADFDNGGQGVAYYDTTPGNTGSQYRQTDVDIASSSAGGYTIGWIADGEWLAYSMTVAAAGSYNVQFLVASPESTGTLHAEFGATATAAVGVPNTGGWQNWTTITVPITLAAGPQVMRVVFDTGGFNLTSITITAAPAATASTPPDPPSSVSIVPTTYTAISDRVVRPKPALPTLGPAGYHFTDPAFGSPLVRVTDASTRPSSVGLSYRSPSESSNRAWNLSSTRFYVTSTDGTIVPFGFDSTTMTASRLPGAEDGGLILFFDAEPEFSAISPDVAYGSSNQYDHAVVTQYNFATNSYGVVADVHTLVPDVDANGRTYLRDVQTGVTAGVEYMSFIFGGTSQNLDHYAVWFPVNDLGSRKLVDTLASTINGVPTSSPLGFHAHAVGIDQSGRYVVIGTTLSDIAAGKAPSYVWDTLNDTFTPMTLSGGGHGAMGFGVAVNNPDDSDSTDFTFRELDVPNSGTRLLVQQFPSPLDFSASSHLSWSNSQPNQLVPVVAALFRYGNDVGPWRNWDEEVIAVRTDGVESRVWRFAHHRSDYNNNGPTDTDPFWYTPRPNVSPDGRWAIFTSNWEKTLGDDTREVNKRQDVFVVGLQ